MPLPLHSRSGRPAPQALALNALGPYRGQHVLSSPQASPTNRLLPGSTRRLPCTAPALRSSQPRWYAPARFETTGSTAGLMPVRLAAARRDHAPPSRQALDGRPNPTSTPRQRLSNARRVSARVSVLHSLLDRNRSACSDDRHGDCCSSSLEEHGGEAKFASERGERSRESSSRGRSLRRHDARGSDQVGRAQLQPRRRDDRQQHGNRPALGLDLSAESPAGLAAPQMPANHVPSQSTAP